MYASRDSLQELLYGYDRQQLYFRLDQADLLRQLCGKDGCFELRLSGRQVFHLRYLLSDQSLSVLVDGKQLASGTAVCQQILELAIPLEVLQLQPGDSLSLSCHALQKERENGRWPTEGSASFCYRGCALDEDNWSV